MYAFFRFGVLLERFQNANDVPNNVRLEMLSICRCFLFGKL